MKTLIREPLVHFLAIGLGLFILFEFVAPDVSDFGRNFLPATGIGARFVVSQKHRVSLSADLAVGKDGTEFYFGVGEAF